MRNALQYSEVITDLFNSIEEYKKEFENPVPCHVMKKVHRDNIFKFYEEIKKMGYSAKSNVYQPGGGK